MKTENSIDIVITWVDGNDPEWRSEKNKTRYGKEQLAETDDREERFRDWENLRYWFRGIENCAPWVRKVHFVTWGHLPKWLNTKHPKLNIVRHTDYIPSGFLPTFNSHTIEWNMHRIPGLSEQFVYFNDDMFLLKRTDETDFFRNGRPVDMLALQPDVANVDNPVMPYIYLNNAMVLANPNVITNRLSNFVSFYGIATYAYKHKYILNFNVRADGSNKFGQDKSARFLPIWSLSAKANSQFNHFLH